MEMATEGKMVQGAVSLCGTHLKLTQHRASTTLKKNEREKKTNRGKMKRILRVTGRKGWDRRAAF